MKLNFTQLGLIFLMLFGANCLMAQDINTLTITDPPEVAGNYITYVAAGWGGQDAISGAATFIDDGADPITNACGGSAPNVNGKIAFVDRGTCSFVEKALTAQASGAIGVVICNNVPLEGLPPLGFDADGPFMQVEIPVLGLSMEDCMAIRVVAEGNDVQVESRYYCGVPTYDASVVWGTNPGEGDFDGGPNEWTVTTESDNQNTDETSWRWSDSSSVPGAFSTRAAIVEGTACNGYMVFPSDFYDNLGTEDPVEFMSGTCPVDPLATVMCNGSLISPNIDLSGSDATGLFCQFYHDWGYYYNGYTSLIVSYDDGVTWPDTTLVTVGEPNPLQPEINFNDGCTPPSATVNERGEGRYSIPISSYNGQDQIRLQFRHSGGYYHATIDDVILVDGSYSDVEIRRGYFAQAPAIAMPASQAQEIPLHVDIFNLGSLDASDVSIKAEGFIGGNPTPVWSAVNDQFANQPAYCFLNENFSFTQAYTPEAIVGSHRVLYSNITPNDAFASNDTLSFGFNLTEETWATTAPGEDVAMFDNLIEAPVGVDFAIAYPFYIPKGKGQYLNEVKFGVANEETNSGQIRVYLYEWNPGELSFPATIGSGNEYMISSDETNIVGSMGEVYGSPQTGVPIVSDPIPFGIPVQSEITVKMAKATDAGQGDPDYTPAGGLKALALKDDQQYVLIFVVTPADDIPVRFLGQGSREGTPYYQTATNAAAFYNQSTKRYTPSIADVADEGSFAVIDNLTFENGYAAHMPWIEMTISPTPLAGFTSVEDITDAADASVSVYPNPATEVINIDINLEQVSPQVSFELLNVSGQVVRTANYNNVKNGNFKMNVKDLTAGVYTFNVRSEAGFTTRKVVVQN